MTTATSATTINATASTITTANNNATIDIQSSTKGPLEIFSHDPQLSFLSNLLDTGKLALYENRYQDAIACFDDALGNIKSHLLSTISLYRAAAFELAGHYQLAYNDACSAIQYANHASAEGYLCAGKLLLLQDNLREAALNYHRGVTHVPRSNPSHSALVNMQQTVAAEIDRRNTWKLPYDVVSHIISLLSLKDRVHFAATSKFWRNYIFKSAAMWHTLDISPKLSTYSTNQLMMAATKQHVRKLKLYSKEALNLVAKYGWENIESLVLDIGDWLGSDALVRHVFQLNHRSLRKLALHKSPLLGSHSFLADALTACPGITHLALDTHPSDNLGPPTINSQSLAPLPDILFAITHLYITDARVVGYLPTLLQRCPKLRHLALAKHNLLRNDSMILRTIHQYCPHICSFRYGIPSLVKSYRPPGLLLSERKKSNGGKSDRGLKYLAYFPYDGSTVDDDLAPVIEANHNTLEAIYLDMSAIVGRSFSSVTALISLGATQLRELQLYNYILTGFGITSPEIAAEHLCGIFQACTSLEVVNLRRVSAVNNDVLDALGSLIHLKRLHLAFKSYSSTSVMFTKEGIRHFFEKTPHLQEFHFHTENPFIADEILYAVGGHQGLQRLELWSDSSLAVKGVSEFAIQMQNSDLTHIVFRAPPYLSVIPTDFAKLGMVKKLMFLELRGYKESGVLKHDLLATFFQQRSLTLNLHGMMERQLTIILKRGQVTEEYLSDQWLDNFHHPRIIPQQVKHAECEQKCASASTEWMW
ncbi:hypothetical protein BDA99DRAFT_497720 [Phascolomyces articulosus]|uniref:F-box domain-containing protein n=1 Tax=Phascolomyces articulosus TaxID=60185 RepID=A0AAD5PII4_9FUNG|nr:hypothetical protein BDA99DRAFT_497720 [Phascolomyces articulosus]